MPQYADDPTIRNDEILWRNVPPNCVVPDENTGVMRPSSAAFGDDKDGSPMSVTLASVALEFGWTVDRQLHGLDDFSLASISAGRARDFEQAIARDPDPPNRAHCVVVGEKTRPTRRGLAKSASWVLLR